MATKTNAPETAEPPSTLDVKEAVRKAVVYFSKLYPNAGTSANLMLEESEDGSYLLVTLGYDIPRRVSPLAGNLRDILAHPQFDRHYKVFKVDAKTGRIVSMKTRSLG